MDIDIPKICPHCKGRDLYARQIAELGYTSHFPVGLGEFLVPPKFNLMVCATCGHCRFFVERHALANLPRSRDWAKVASEPE